MNAAKGGRRQESLELRRILQTSLKGDVRSEFAEGDWEQGCT